jgi:DnaJ like chaperone protein
MRILIQALILFGAVFWALRILFDFFRSAQQLTRAGRQFGQLDDELDDRNEAPLSEALNQNLAQRKAEAEHVFFHALFSMLAKLAKADGRISEEEIRVIGRFMDEVMQLQGERRRQAQEIFRQAKDSAEDFESYAEHFYSLFRREPQVLLMMASVLESVALADGPISQEETKLLQSALRIFRLTGYRFHTHGHSQNGARQERTQGAQSTRTATLTREDALAELGLESAADIDEIKRAYRTLVKECHPDLLISKGLPPELRLQAQERFIRIQRAYEVLVA